MYFVRFEHLGFEKITFSLSLSRGNTTILYIIYIYTIQNYMVQKKKLFALSTLFRRVYKYKVPYMAPPLVRNC